MKEKKKRLNNWMDGFTLVELIVVLVILSVLSAVAVPTVLGYIDDSKAKECRTQVEALTAEISSAKMAAEVNGEEDGIAFDVQAYINAAGDSGKCPVDGNTAYQYIEGENKIICPNNHGEGIISGSGKFTVAVAEDTGKRESPDAVQKYKAQIQVESGSTNMKPEEHAGLHVTVTDEHGNPIPDENVTVTWTFPNDGSVQGTPNGTKATLDAKKAGGGQVSCTVTVTKEDGTTETVPCGPVNVTVTDPQPEYNAKIVVEAGSPNNMNPGDRTDLHVTVTDEHGNPVPDDRVTVTWTFPNDGSVQGTSNGTKATLDAKEAGGGQVSCTVTVTKEDGTTETVPCGPVDVTVNEKEPELHLEVGSLEVSAGEGGNLNARAVDENGGNYSGEVKYSYEVTPQDGDDGGITVDENGNVHGVTPGTCHVTVTVTDKNDPNKKESKTVEVTVEAKETETQPEKEGGGLLKSGIDRPLRIEMSHVSGTVNNIDEFLKLWVEKEGGKWTAKGLNTTNSSGWTFEHVHYPEQGIDEWVDFTYTLGDESETVTLRVVHPMTQLQPCDNVTIDTLEEQVVRGVQAYQPGYTDDHVEEWRILEGADCLKILSLSEDGMSARVQPLKAGKVRIKLIAPLLRGSDVPLSDERWNPIEAELEITINDNGSQKEDSGKTETETFSPNEVEIDGQQFKATSWEAFKAAVEANENYQINRKKYAD